MPDDVSSVYSSYPADSGMVYLHIDGQLKNLMQREIRISELFDVSAKYDNQYNYTGFNIVSAGNRFDWVSSYSAAKPLQTAHIHSLIECPKEVNETDKPVSITIKTKDTEYQYNVR